MKLLAMQTKDNRWRYKLTDMGKKEYLPFFSTVTNLIVNRWQMVGYICDNKSGAYFGESKEAGEITALIEILIHYFGIYRAARLFTAAGLCPSVHQSGNSLYMGR